MKKIVQFLLIFMLTLIIGWMVSCGRDPIQVKGQVFLTREFYIYVMGSYNYFSPLEEHYLELGPIVRMPLPGCRPGYRVVNIRDRLFISLEGDYSPAVYDFADFARDQKISTLPSWSILKEESHLKKFL